MACRLLQIHWNHFWYRMHLSSDELEILEYLKSWKGTSVSMIEICRCAGGRQRFRENPHWAKGLMSRLVDEQLVEVNERGHYCVVGEAENQGTEKNPADAPTLQPTDAA